MIWFRTRLSLVLSDLILVAINFGYGLGLVLVCCMLKSGYELVLLETFQDKQYDTNQLGDYFENLIQKGYNDFENFIDEYLSGNQ